MPWPCGGIEGGDAGGAEGGGGGALGPAGKEPFACPDCGAFRDPAGGGSCGAPPVGCEFSMCFLPLVCKVVPCHGPATIH